MRFHRYGHVLERDIEWDELISEQQRDGLLWAHAENSGCESEYVEVAKWNGPARRYERYVHVKCLDFRLPDMPDASDDETAIEAAKRINAAAGWHDNGDHPIVHSMPNANELTELEKYCKELIDQREQAKTAKAEYVRDNCNRLAEQAIEQITFLIGKLTKHATVA